MRRLEKLFLCGCGYTVLILALFYLFAAISKFASPAILPKNFFLILAFGMIISCADMLYDILNVKKILKAIIHYFVLLIMFCVVFLVSGNIAGDKAASIFIAIFVFTVLYFVLLLIVTLIKKTVSTADDIVEKKAAKNENAAKKSKKAKEPYKPLYKADTEK